MPVLELFGIEITCKLIFSRSIPLSESGIDWESPLDRSAMVSRELVPECALVLSI
jgi:hypothetical protein